MATAVNERSTATISPSGSAIGHKTASRMSLEAKRLDHDACCGRTSEGCRRVVDTSAIIATCDEDDATPTRSLNADVRRLFVSYLNVISP